MEPVRTAPSGPFAGLARLVTAAPVALSTGVLTEIDCIVQFEGGDIGKIPSPAVAPYTFQVGPGAYVISAQVNLAAPQGTSIKAFLTFATGSSQQVAKAFAGATSDGVSVTLNALARKTDTPLTAAVFAGIALQVTATGTTTTGTAQIMIQRVAFDG
jgi:hypothetical protein